MLQSKPNASQVFGVGACWAVWRSTTPYAAAQQVRAPSISACAATA